MKEETTVEWKTGKRKIRSGKFLGLIRDTSGKLFVIIEVIQSGPICIPHEVIFPTKLPMKEFDKARLANNVLNTTTAKNNES